MSSLWRIKSSIKELMNGLTMHIAVQEYHFEGNYLGVATACFLAIFTTLPTIGSTSIGRPASRSTNIDGLKRLGEVLRSSLYCSRQSAITWSTLFSGSLDAVTPVLRATETTYMWISVSSRGTKELPNKNGTSSMIPLTAGSVTGRSWLHKKSATGLRETVHRVEKVAFLGNRTSRG